MSVVLYMYRRQYDENVYSIYMSSGAASTQLTNTRHGHKIMFAIP